MEAPKLDTPERRDEDGLPLDRAPTIDDVRGGANHFKFAVGCSAILMIVSMLSGRPLTSLGCAVGAAVFLVGSALLLCLGVMGEYLGRVYDEVRQRPLSIINKVYYASDTAAAISGSEDEEKPAAKLRRIA